MTKSFSIDLQTNLDKFVAVSRAWAKASGKTEAEAVRRQSSKLAWNIYKGMREIRPAKGSLMAQGLDLLKSGQGVHVRKSVMDDVLQKYKASSMIGGGLAMTRRGKLIGSFIKSGVRMNVQALAVERELKLRERAIGFSAFSVPRISASGDVTYEVKNQMSRYGFKLSNFLLSAADGHETKYAKLTWFGSFNSGYQSATEGLETAKQQAVLKEAVDVTIADTMVYLQQKSNGDIQKFFS